MPSWQNSAVTPRNASEWVHPIGALEDGEVDPAVTATAALDLHAGVQRAHFVEPATFGL